MLGLDQPADDTEKKPEPTQAAAKGWGESIAMKIVDNMQIFIDKVGKTIALDNPFQVHVRYEDSQSVPGKPFSFGITLDHIHIQSTDYDWKPGMSCYFANY